MQRPVFVVGCPRSGTTLLYSMMVAAGGFAAYRKETYFYDLVSRFPDLSDRRSHERFTSQFLNGYLGKVAGLDVRPFVDDALGRCRNSGEFLPLLMEDITKAQGMDRWIEGTPVHVLYMNEIKRAVPDALFVHVIRDGRDCALSNTGQQWVSALPWDKRRKLGVAALYWQWMVRAGRAYCRTNPADCFEMRFEDLIADPSSTLVRIGDFIDHDLDYERIQRNPVHALKRPNTSYREERDRADFNPVGRWKDKCPPQDLELCEALIGRLLIELGYDVVHPAEPDAVQFHARLMQALYPRYFAAKHFLKARTPLGRILTRTQVWMEQPKAGEDPVRPTPAHSATTLGCASQIVSH